MQRSSRHGMAYCRDIDGLRALAVLAVLAYHLGLTECPGGFVGVDIFFVISGYLITASILADARDAGFSLLAFYDRRIRRICPALLVMAVLTSLVVAIFLPPSQLADYGTSLASMGALVSNLYLSDVAAPGGYFAKVSNETFLLHTWSLSVEEQFYLVMPALLVLAGRRSDAFKLALVVVLGLASFVTSLVALELRPTAAFYGMPSRAWELLLGSVLAFDVGRREPSRRSLEVLSLLGLGMIGYAIVGFSHQTPFPGPAALFPCGGAVLLIATGRAGDTTVKRMLSTRPMVNVGLVSYSLYLWHWPIVAVARDLTLGHLDLPIRVAIVAASLAAAGLSYRFVEQPFRLQLQPSMRWKTVAGGLAASAAVVGIGTAFAASGGLPQRFSPNVRTLMAANERRESEHPIPACENFQKDVRAMRDILFCPIGDEPRHVMFWGDSHVHLLEPVVRQLHDEGRLGEHSAIFAISAACPIALDLERTAKGFHCAAFTRLALRRALQSDVDTVFFGFAAWFDLKDGEVCRMQGETCGPALPHAEVDALFLTSLREIVVALQSRGKTVVVALPAPCYSDSVAELLSKKLALGRIDALLDVESRLRRYDFIDLRERVRALARALHVRTFDPREALCHDGTCLYARDGVSLYTDNNHVATSQVGIFRPALVAALEGNEPTPHLAGGFRTAGGARAPEP